MKFFGNTRGTAYTFLIIGALFILFTILYILMSPVVNNWIAGFNENILPMGIVSTKTIDTLNFQVRMWNMIPIIIVLVLFLFYPIIRALMKKAEGD